MHHVSIVLNAIEQHVPLEEGIKMKMRTDLEKGDLEIVNGLTEAAWSDINMKQLVKFCSVNNVPNLKRRLC